jgi:hypothetical protein
MLEGVEGFEEFLRVFGYKKIPPKKIKTFFL